MTTVQQYYAPYALAHGRAGPDYEHARSLPVRLLNDMILVVSGASDRDYANTV